MGEPARETGLSCARRFACSAPAYVSVDLIAHRTISSTDTAHARPSLQRFAVSISVPMVDAAKSKFSAYRHCYTHKMTVFRPDTSRAAAGRSAIRYQTGKGGKLTPKPPAQSNASVQRHRPGQRTDFTALFVPLNQHIARFRHPSPDKWLITSTCCYRCKSNMHRREIANSINTRFARFQGKS